MLDVEDCPEGETPEHMTAQKRQHGSVLAGSKVRKARAAGIRLPRRDTFSKL